MAELQIMSSSSVTDTYKAYYFVHACTTAWFILLSLPSYKKS